MVGMDSIRGGGSPFWVCAAFTVLSAAVSAGFSLLSLRMVSGHEYALYAASRSIALVLVAVFAMTSRSRGGVAALAVAMTLVQFFDAIVGFLLHDPGRAYTPAPATTA